MFLNIFKKHEGVLTLSAASNYLRTRILFEMDSMEQILIHLILPGVLSML